jgi:hypothetical protein
MRIEGDRQLHYARPSRDILDVLPAEIIYRILDFLEPRDMRGLPSTCRRSLKLVNAKLKAEYHWLGEDDEVTTISMTARIMRLLRQWAKEMDVSDPGYHPLDEDDADL